MPFRWAVLGTGLVAHKFVLGLRHADVSTDAHVVASRNQENAARMARKLGIPHVAASYEEAVRRTDVDAVYVATPPSVHRDHAIAAIEAGKPVLVEKPFAMSGAQAEEIATAAGRAGVYCMEGMWTRFLPLVRQLRARLEAGSLGSIRCLEASFCSPAQRDPRASLFSAALGGGALMHRGCYPLSLARHLLGPVAEVTSLATCGVTGVDEEVLVSLRHESGALSSLRASLVTGGRSALAVHGTAGSIIVDAPIYRPWRMTVNHVRAVAPSTNYGGRWEAVKEGTLLQSANQRISGALSALRKLRDETVVERYIGNGYHYEAQALMRDVADGRKENVLMPLHESVELMELIDEARGQWS
jgi:predicted dehydrogenase